ncbi:hypothetical protein TNCV_463811 [Trichonephila clavipes]|nr:hypothetical protein TNCV_463811 [Trichonephila clavipes]
MTKFTLDTKGQVFQGHESRNMSFQKENFDNVPVGLAIFVSGDKIGMVHRKANEFRIILRDAGNEQFDGDRLTTIVN